MTGLMPTMTLIYWTAAFLIFYVYLGYPLMVWTVARIMGRKRIDRAGITPVVTLIISAYNEEAVIGRKIKNSLALDYPREGIEIIDRKSVV